jgi:hypothetical protein
VDRGIWQPPAQFHWFNFGLEVAFTSTDGG